LTFKVKTKGQIEGEKLLVPKLRFKEFNSEYKKYKIGDTLKVKSGKDQKSIECINGTYPILGTGGQIGTTNSFLYDKPSVLIGRKGTINKPQYMTTPFWTVDTLFYTDIKEEFNTKYIFYAFQNINWKKYDESTGVPSLSCKTIEEILYYIPNKDEQDKISTFITLLDKKIELQNQKIEALKIYKKGLMQKLINSNNCEEKSISEFGTIITGTTPSKLIQSYWHNGTIVWVTPSDITESKDIYNSHDMLTPDGLKAGRFVPAGSILITCIASIGKNAILKVDGSCNQQINAIIPNKNFNADYLYYLFELKKDYLQSTAGTSATSIINKTSFEKLVFKIHNIGQQNEYSKILNCLESKIETEKHKFKKLTLLKKSLLQQMFI